MKLDQWLDERHLPTATMPPPFKQSNTTSCEPCQGSGFIITFHYNTPEILEIEKSCELCKGSGYRPRNVLVDPPATYTP